MKIATLLRAIHLMRPARPPAPDDQIYAEAAMENAVRESNRAVERIHEVAANGAHSNARLTAAIERLAISNVDKEDAMTELVRGMKTRGGVI